MLIIGGRNYYYGLKYLLPDTVYVSIEELSKEPKIVEKYDHIIIFSSPILASTRFGRSDFGLENLMNLLQLSGKKIIFISSSAVYGLSQSKEPFTETSPLLGDSKYALEKIHIESILKSQDLTSIIIRPSGFFGSFYNHTPDSLINKLRSKIKTNCHYEFNIEHQGEQLRDFTDVRLLMRLIVSHIESNCSSNRVLNFSTTCGIKIRHITDHAKLLNPRLVINYIESDDKRIHNTLRVDSLLRFYPESYELNITEILDG